MDGIDLTTQRLRAGLKQWQVAAALGYTSAWLSRLERGRAPLNPETADRISDAIDKLALKVA